jgi:soluble lytic murein transglycosylase-like protein
LGDCAKLCHFLTMPLVQKWLVLYAFAVHCALSAAQAPCFAQAGEYFHIDPKLLRAIAQVESAGHASALSALNHNGTHDMGLMQINSAWLGVLKNKGIDSAMLMQPCTSIQVGAWILALNMNRYGRTWRAVGAYNAQQPELQLQYARRVEAEYQKLIRN